LGVYDLLTILPFGTAVGGAIEASKIAGAETVAVAVGVAAGAAVGVLCVVAVYRVGSWMLSRDPRPSDRQLWLLYSAAFAWSFASSFLGYQSAALTLRAFGFV
jgi:hypothetical protein